MERFLNEEAVQHSKARVRRNKRILCALTVAMLVSFVVLCLLTRTGNARAMLYLAMAETVLCGWGIIAFWLFSAEPSQAEEQHLAGLAQLEPETREGRLFMTESAFRIPRSVRIRKVRLETENESLSLNLNERLAHRMPPDGSRVRVETARKFITGVEVLETGSAQSAFRKPDRPGKRIFRAVGRFFLPAVLWAMLALVFTGFVFNQITDAAPADKIVIYADCEVNDAPPLAEKLENALGGAVRLVKIHPFSYAMFGSDRLKQADLYIVPDSHKEEYQEWFLPEAGVTVYDPSSGAAVAPDVFCYSDEPYRLYPGSASVHREDGLARTTAELLIYMTKTEKEKKP